MQRAQKSEILCQPGDKTGKKTIDFRRRERPAVKKSGWGLYMHTQERGGELPCVFSLQLSWGLLLPSEERREVHKTK